jgi:Methyltransferase domain
MELPNPWRPFKRGTRELIARGVGRYGYALVCAAGAGESPEGMERVNFISIPRERQEPFSTSEYDVLPKGRFDIVRRDYYSPIPDLSTLPADIWLRRSEMHGVDLDPDAGIVFVERELAPFVAELEVPLEDPRHPGVFFLRNPGFGSVDAELLYGMIRFARPKRIIELGSGYTTLLINMAARRNLNDGASTQHVAYDPYPREQVLGPTLPKPTRLEAISATDVPLEVFTELEAGDVLFVDTTHTVKLGSDVNFIILDVLPRLQPGVLVHFHDIFLPWEYPRVWFEQMQYYWAEQYLLQAFLAFNRAFSVVIPASAVAREHPGRLGQAIPSFVEGVNPGSLWLRRSERPTEPRRH